jgi:DNA-binding MarR family transcriptional regulator
MAGSGTPPQQGDFDAGANRLGALALRLVDRIADAVEETPAGSATSAAALSSLHHFLDRPTIDRLRQVLGLSHSGAVRLVDRLADAGLVRRQPGADARSTVVVLTAAGKRAAQRATAARATVLASALSGLTATEREQLDQLVSRVLVGLMHGPGAGSWMCRMCDTATCGLADGSCPVTDAAQQKWGG